MQDFNPLFGYAPQSGLNAHAVNFASQDLLTPDLNSVATIGKGQLHAATFAYESSPDQPQPQPAPIGGSPAVAIAASVSSTSSKSSKSGDNLVGQAQVMRVGTNQVDALTNRDAGDRFAKATRVQLRNGRLRVSDSLGEDDEFDFYRFDLDCRTNFNVTLNRSDGNVEMTLYDRKRNVIAVSNEGDGEPEFIRRKLQLGSYVLGIRLIEGDVDYTLKSKAIDLPGLSFRDALDVEPSNGALLRGTYNYNGSLNVSQKERFAYYQFTLTQSSTFAGVVENLSVDATIELFNSNQQLIAIFNATDSTASLTQVLEAGDYFFRIRIQSGATRYRLCLCFDEVDLIGNATDTATVVDFGSDIALPDDAVGAIDTEDYYRFDLITPSHLELSLTDLSVDADLQLYDGNGVLLSSSENDGTAADLITRNLAAGTYYARVYLAESGFTFYDLDYDVFALPVFGLNDVNQLIGFNISDATENTVPITLTGLGEGEFMQSIDFRPSTGQLYGLSSSNNLYTIDLATGATTQVGATLTPTLIGTAFDIDFDPVLDQLRLVSDADENLLVDPTTGAIALTGTPLFYSASDANALFNPTVTEIAYTGNLLGGTTLYGIDTALGIVVQQGNTSGIPLGADTGTLVTVGTTDIDFTAATGFDIVTDEDGDSTGYVVTDNGDEAGFYSIDMETGEVLQDQVVFDSVPVNLISLAAIG